MSDFRHDPIDDQWVSIADHRCDRPMEFEPVEKIVSKIVCPFCRGNESETPTTRAAYSNDGSLLSSEDSEWSTRVVNNKFPSFSLCADGDQTKPGNESEGLFGTSKMCGVQELIIPTSRHVVSLSELTKEELLVAFRANQDRIGLQKSIPIVKHTMLFLNCGSSAGASLSHIHFQLIGTPVIGRFLHGRVERNQYHRGVHGCSIIESLTEQEIEQQIRIVETTDNFCVVCPFASRFAFQIRIVPKTQSLDFSACPADVRNELAELCQKTVARLESVLDKPSYNLLLQTEPFDSDRSSSSTDVPWYVEIFPRLTKAAGLEWGTDVWVNPVPPEIAAKRLREIKPTSIF